MQASSGAGGVGGLSPLVAPGAGAARAPLVRGEHQPGLAPSKTFVATGCRAQARGLREESPRQTLLHSRPPAAASTACRHRRRNPESLMSLPPPFSFAPAAPPIGRLRLLWHLLKVAREEHPGISPRALWRTLKMLGHKLRWLGPLRSWHSDASNPARREMLGHRPSLVLAVGRPYINDRWPVPRRLDAIWEHYSLLRGPLGFLRFDAGAQLPLASVETE